ncbi:hypothetical protein [Salinicola aestuarinus]|uniref:hypothetical protein n=1 Tax=Salinicola aestuarinus TaxID=1949082 RepID=UPI000DA190CF|nr:hypothetical protein [Salinicola aestuarinus]
MRSPFRRSPLLALLVALAVLNGVFLALEFPWAGFPPAHALALEAVASVGLAALLPPFRGRRWLTGAIALFAVVIALCAIGDTLVQRMQGRSLNLYTDLGLIPILIELMVSNLGMVVATALIVALGIAAFLLGLGLQHLLRSFHGHNTPWPLALGLTVLGVGGLAGIVPLSESEATESAAKAAISSIGRPVWGFIDFEWQRALDTRIALDNFGERLAAETPYPAEGLPLSGLADIHVILGFIESYGVAAIERDPFAGTVKRRLASLQRTLDDAGLSVVTGRVTAATLGGQSWLNHATFLSGLPITSQLRFELMMNRSRPTLIDDFAATGHRTLAVMPGITRAWPEGERYGYDAIHTENSMHYRGPPIGWASMPDQFTWQRVAEYALTGIGSPTFTELATLSSHAPWYPVIEPLDDWHSLGDGKAFARWTGVGDDYATLWQDPDRMRDYYAPAIDYALASAAGFASRYVDDHTLLIVLGDHQAAPAVIGSNPGRDVPIHVISGDPALLTGFLDAGFRPGTLPPGPESARPMETMRGLLHRLYGEARNAAP